MLLLGEADGGCGGGGWGLASKRSQVGEGPTLWNGLLKGLELWRV